MVLFLTEVNCTLLKERLKSGQNWAENQPLRTPEGLISRTRLEKGRWNFGILHRSTQRLCVPILSKIGWPSFPSLPRSLRQKLLNNSTNGNCRLIIWVGAGSHQSTKPKTLVTKIRYRVISFTSKRITSLVGLNLTGTFLGLKVNSKLH